MPIHPATHHECARHHDQYSTLLIGWLRISGFYSMLDLLKWQTLKIMSGFDSSWLISPEAHCQLLKDACGALEWLFLECEHGAVALHSVISPDLSLHASASYVEGSQTAAV
jgi:hypothetical protein